MHFMKGSIALENKISCHQRQKIRGNHKFCKSFCFLVVQTHQRLQPALFTFSNDWNLFRKIIKRVVSYKRIVNQSTSSILSRVNFFPY